jgi:hypothetical protein
MILLVYDVGIYRKKLAETIRPTDTVIEIGPHVGASTRIIAARAKRVIAVDKAEQAAQAFKKSKPGNVTFIKGDVRMFGTIDKVLKITDRCDVLAVDMGGGRFPDTLFKVWCNWSGVFKPRDSVLRNNGLAEFVKRVKIEDPSLEIDYSDSGWLSQTGRKTPDQMKEGLKELQKWIVKGK